MKAVKHFLSAKRLGSENYQQEYEGKLAQQIDEEFQVFTRMNNDRDASLWWKSSLACGVACAGVGLAGVPMLPGILAGAGSISLATWVDKRFNQGRVSNQVSYMAARSVICNHQFYIIILFYMTTVMKKRYLPYKENFLMIAVHEILLP